MNDPILSQSATRRARAKRGFAAIRLATLLFASMAGAGCTKALYYYETEKFSLTIEAKPDATEPVSGSLGIKQRVAAVVPRMKVPANGDGKGGEKWEGVSLLSFFDLKKDKTKGVPAISQPVTIVAAVVSGKAAKDLGPGKGAEALKALVQPTVAFSRDANSDKIEKWLQNDPIPADQRAGDPKSRQKSLRQFLGTGVEPLEVLNGSEYAKLRQRIVDQLVSK